VRDMYILIYGPMQVADVPKAPLGAATRSALSRHAFSQSTAPPLSPATLCAHLIRGANVELSRIFREDDRGRGAANGPEQ
jgi:hypothetical protein